MAHLVSDAMEEKPAGTGIYEWESAATIDQMNLDKGVYLVQTKASLASELPSTDILLFHTDPDTEAQSTTPLTPVYYITIAIVIMSAILGTILLERRGRMLKIGKTDLR